MEYLVKHKSFFQIEKRCPFRGPVRVAIGSESKPLGALMGNSGSDKSARMTQVMRNMKKIIVTDQ